MVRARPVLSVFLISVFCLRVSVILFLGACAAPCSLRKYSNNAVLSASSSLSSMADLLTPALLSCSSNNVVGRPNSAANCATVDCAIYCSSLLLFLYLISN